MLWRFEMGARSLLSVDRIDFAAEASLYTISENAMTAHRHGKSGGSMRASLAIVVTGRMVGVHLTRLFQRAVSDVAPEGHAVEVDLRHALVGMVECFFE